MYELIRICEAGLALKVSFHPSKEDAHESMIADMIDVNNNGIINEDDLYDDADAGGCTISELSGSIMGKGCYMYQYEIVEIPQSLPAPEVDRS